MSRSPLGRALHRVGGAVALLFVATTAYAQQSTVAVTVTEVGKTKPVDQAQVVVSGSTIGGLTNFDGKVILRGVPVGAQTIRVLRVGYQEQKKPVTVVAGQQATVEFQLLTVAVSLAPVVTTATGEQRRVEVGNAVSVISASKTVEAGTIKSVDDLLQARTSNLVVTSGTQTGSGSRMRIRGVASMSLSNEPIFVIDGIRMTSTVSSSALFTGGSQPSRVGDINPDEIENIEIVKGPSAAALYGTAAANGVVVITTKRGRAGSARWTTYGEAGTLQDRNTYPTAYTLFGKANPSDANELGFQQCQLQRVGIGTCFVDSVAKLNLFDVDSLTPVGTGDRYQLGAQLSGGTESIRYFLAGERENETGVLELPPFERARFSRDKIPLHDWTDRPNTLQRNSMRLNLNTAVNPKLDLSLSSNFTNVNQRFSLESNATAGIGSQAFGGPGCVVCIPNRVVQAQTGQPALNTPLYGYRAWTPGYSWQEKAGQRANRFILGGNGNWRPTSWLQNRMTIGSDFTDRVDDDFIQNGEGTPIGALERLGRKDNTRTDIRNVTIDIGSTASYNLTSYINLKTTLGTQYVNSVFEQNEAFGQELPPGAQTPNGAVTRQAFESTTLQKTLGIFVEEAAALNDRLFLTAAVRTDQNSAFGTNFQRVYYPKGSLSWIISDEDFFPKFGWMNQLRLRVAYGASGVQPGPNDAIRFFSSSIQSIRAADLGGLQINALGNSDLKPERSAEFETGFETKLLQSRLSLDVTYYDKKTKDALISAIVPPSVGSAQNVRKNLGQVRNWGQEYLVTGQLFDSRNFASDVSVSYSHNSNEVVSLGGTPTQKGTNVWVAEGYTINGFWENPILGYKDKNGDGLLTYFADPTKNEVFVGDSDVFLGYSQPRDISTITNGFDFLNRRLRLQTLFDFRGGHKWYNMTERIRCTRPNCGGRMDPGAAPEEKATTTAALENPQKTNAGYFQKGAYWRFRELSLQYTLSEGLAARIFRSRTANIVGSARNLKHWAPGYRGVDPEADFTGSTGDAPSEFQTVGPPSYFTIRFNVVY